MKYCENCGAPLDDDSIFCAECGTKTEQENFALIAPMGYCAECGAPFDAGDEFCEECGAKTEQADSLSKPSVPIGYCAECGTPYDVGDEFCAECGTKTEQADNLSKMSTPIGNYDESGAQLDNDAQFYTEREAKTLESVIPVSAIQTKEAPKYNATSDKTSGLPNTKPVSRIDVRKEERASHNKKAAIFVVLAIVVAIVILIAFLWTSGKFNFSQNINKNSVDSDAVSEMTPTPMPTPSPTLSPTPTSTPIPTPTADLNDFLGYWYMGQSTEKELLLSYVGEKEIVFSLQYYRLDSVENITAPLVGNTAKFSVLDEYYNLQGAITFEESSITVNITESNREYIPTGRMTFDHKYEQSQLSAESVTATSELEYMVLQGNQRYYSENELLGRSAYELSILRNGLFALSGKQFVINQEVKAFFEACTWYSPNTEDDDVVKSRFNQYQKSNLEMILQIENSSASQPNAYNYAFFNIEASNTLEPQGDNHYEAYLVQDGDPNTAWNCQGGVGEWIMLSANNVEQVNGLRILNGYTKFNNNNWLYFLNNRPKDITIAFSDGTLTSCTLEDYFDGDNYYYQNITFARPKQTTFIKIFINSVYNGTKWNETCISEIEVY